MVRTKLEAARYSSALGRKVRVGAWLKEKPCVPAGLLRAIREETGRRCPRVELLPGNAEAFELLLVMAREETRGAVEPYLAGLSRGMSNEGRFRVLRRAVSALNNAKVNEILHPRASHPRAR